MDIGFTGTQEGMTPEQKLKLYQILAQHTNGMTLHLGDCIGADTEAYEIAYMQKAHLTGHPCTLTHKRSFLEYDEEREIKQPLDRNHDIVDESDELIAAPKEHAQVLRSGTWATVRYAQKKGKKITIIYPDGIVVYL